VHDTIWFESVGRPAVSIASTEFVDAARIQAEALGLPEVPRVYVAHPIQDATDDEMRAKADAAVDAVVRALTR
jgi:hypothetical protein